MTPLSPRRFGVLVLPLALLSALAVGGCNTVSGAGEDISAAGRAVDQTSQATEKKVFKSGESTTTTQSGRTY